MTLLLIIMLNHIKSNTLRQIPSYTESFRLLSTTLIVTVSVVRTNLTSFRIKNCEKILITIRNNDPLEEYYSTNSTLKQHTAVGCRLVRSNKEKEQ